ncbi:MAG: diguanylate cyclase [Actinomycetota bacterium]|nr:diguanylate cyclase [Actinomycetota bacterium]
MGSPRTWAFTARPRRLRAHIGACVVAAVVLPTVVGGVPVAGGSGADLLTAGALVVLSVVNVEISRILDGGLKNSHRPHKALSAWALAAALLLPVWWVLPVVVTCYAHARWRGLRVQLWKWVGSGAYVALAAVAADAVAGAVHGPGTGWVLQGPQALLVVGAAAGVFLAVEVALFHASAYLNDADDEVWLRRTLRSPRFYVTEASMLLVGALSATVWVSNPWLLPLLLPAYGLAQQAALHDPLQQQAQTDPKTGVYRYESWRGLALAERDRCTARQQPWSVVFADLDRFKPYNDTWGHLAGDAALAAVADLLSSQLRSRDLVARFGGEEFCVFLPDTTPADAAEVAERLRVGVEALLLPETEAHVTLSLGVASADPAHGEHDLAQAIHAADQALYRAKERGRNTVHATTLLPEAPGEGDSADAVPAKPPAPRESSVA